MVGPDGVMAPATNVRLTVTASLAEHADAAGVPKEASVTLYEYVVDEDGEAISVGDVAPEIWFPFTQPPATNHW